MVQLMRHAVGKLERVLVLFIEIVVILVWIHRQLCDQYVCNVRDHVNIGRTMLCFMRYSRRHLHRTRQNRQRGRETQR